LRIDGGFPHLSDLSNVVGKLSAIVWIGSPSEQSISYLKQILQNTSPVRGTHFPSEFFAPAAAPDARPAVMKSFTKLIVKAALIVTATAAALIIRHVSKTRAGIDISSEYVRSTDRRQRQVQQKQ
jgi:hypothetical protein